MSDALFRRIVVPVANKADAKATAAALVPFVESTDSTVIAAHVIEKTSGAPDKASVEQRKSFADETFEVVADGLANVDVELQTQYLYGTNVAEAIVDEAHERQASAIVFTPRGGSRWLKLLSGDVTTALISETDLPVVVLPDHSDGEDHT